MTTLTPTDLGTILGIWAHPDDEAYLSAGLMAMANDAGQRVVTVTATRGEAGTDDPGTWPPRRLGRLREAELHASLAALGVTEHHFLDYVDGTLTDVDQVEAVGRLATLVHDVQPDTIVTFGPEGLTGHTDHRRISSWATAARELAAPSARLLYATTTAAHHEQWQAEVYDRFDVYFTPDVPVFTSPERVALQLRLDGPLADRKLVALRAQASQTAGLVAALGEQTYRAWVSRETFRLAPSLVPVAPRRERTGAREVLTLSR
jgi:LmbE family N-acetylglucosaminyl deacetylase